MWLARTIRPCYAGAINKRVLLVLMIKRTEKTEAIITLLQYYYRYISESVGITDEKEGWLMAHSLLDTPIFNVICGHTEPTNVLNSAALLELARNQRKPFIWLLLDNHIHSQQYLINEGLEERGQLQAGVFHLSSNAPNFTSHPAVELVEVSNDEQFYEWCHVFSVSQGMPVEDVEAYFKLNESAAGNVNMYLAQIYQKSVGCCGMFVKDNQSLLLWDTVLPMYRRQGVGSMMVLQRMNIAKDAGCEEVYGFGLHSSEKLLRSLGFKMFGVFNMMRYDCFEEEAEADSNG